MERIQPYHGRKNRRVGPERLSDLAELSNIDKHRRFPLTAQGWNQMSIPSRVEGHAVARNRYVSCPLKPHATILWLDVPSLPRSVKEPHVNFDLGATIEFEGMASRPPMRLAFPHEPVTVTLDAILRFIRHPVVPVFAPFIAAG